MPPASPNTSPVLEGAAGPGPSPGSDRTFGYFFGTLIAGLGLYGLWRGHAWGWVAVALGALLGLLGAVVPQMLRLPNRWWFGLGMLLARIVNPLVIGLMFFVVITPIGLLMRACGKRPLSLQYEPDAPTYWIERKPPGPPPESMGNQF